MRERVLQKPRLKLLNSKPCFLVWLANGHIYIVKAVVGLLGVTARPVMSSMLLA